MSLKSEGAAAGSVAMKAYEAIGRHVIARQSERHDEGVTSARIACRSATKTRRCLQSPRPDRRHLDRSAANPARASARIRSGIASVHRRGIRSREDSDRKREPAASHVSGARRSSVDRRGRRDQNSSVVTFVSRCEAIELHRRAGTSATTRAGKPLPFLGFGKLTKTSAPASGTWSKLVSSSIWK